MPPQTPLHLTQPRLLRAEAAESDPPLRGEENCLGDEDDGNTRWGRSKRAMVDAMNHFEVGRGMVRLPLEDALPLLMAAMQ